MPLAGGGNRQTQTGLLCCRCYNLVDARTKALFKLEPSSLQAINVALLGSSLAPFFHAMGMHVVTRLPVFIPCLACNYMLSLHRGEACAAHVTSLCMLRSHVLCVKVRWLCSSPHGCRQSILRQHADICSSTWFFTCTVSVACSHATRPTTLPPCCVLCVLSKYDSSI